MPQTHNCSARCCKCRIKFPVCQGDRHVAMNRTEWHRVYAWRNLSNFAKTVQKGQLRTLEGILRYREWRMTSRALCSSTGSPRYTPSA
jgi:single-stranded DNA-binding protein